jgi:hypothetical protein
LKLKNRPKKAPHGAPILATRPPPAQARGAIKTSPKSRLGHGFLLQPGQLLAIRFPIGAVIKEVSACFAAIVYSPGSWS